MSRAFYRTVTALMKLWQDPKFVRFVMTALFWIVGAVAAEYLPAAWYRYILLGGLAVCGIAALVTEWFTPRILALFKRSR